jgi:fused signal recognition particle receptor
MTEQQKKKGGLFGWFKSKDQTDKPSTSDAIVEDQPVSTETSTDNRPLENINEKDTVANIESPGVYIDELDQQPQTEQKQTVLGQNEQEQTEQLQPTDVEESDDDEKPNEPVVIVEEPQQKPESLFKRLKSGLSRTRANLSDGLANLFLGQKHIDDDLLEEIETQLLLADIGVEATNEIITTLTDRVARKQLSDPQALYQALKDLLANMISDVDTPIDIDSKKPFVILMVGVNGVGKTTTIGKLAKKFQQEGKSVMLAAGDTFRAAAVEQLQVWGQRNDVTVIAQHTGADSASVIFDAVQAAQKRQVDVIIADTAGRLQTKFNLMDELSKVKRVIQKLDGTAPHEIMLTVDATTGQNALSQVEHFHKAVGITGLTISKLDGTAKGGVVFAIARKMKIPIRYIGVGESIDDLRPFVAKDFINALFDQENDKE